MGFKGITMNTPPTEAPHICAEDDAAIFQSIFGCDGVFNIGQKFEAAVLSNNLVRMGNGVFCVNGHIGRTAYGLYDDFEIANGQSGVNRNDLIVARFQTTGTNGTDTYTVEVKQGTAGPEAADPEITQEDLYQGGKVREYPLYRVKIEGLSIVAVEPLFKIIPTIPELEDRIDELNSELKNCMKSCSTTLTESKTEFGILQQVLLYRVGNIVFIKGNTIINVSETGTKELNVIVPEGYRPTMSIHECVPMFVGDTVTAGRVGINKDTGKIYYCITAAGTREFFWNTTYITNDDFPQ